MPEAVNQEPKAFGFEPYSAASDEEYMSPGQEEHFRQILRAWKQPDGGGGPHRPSHAGRGHQLPGPQRPRHPGVRVQPGAAHPRPGAQADQEDRRGAGALDTHEYGYCEACGVEIGIRRLEARPPPPCASTARPSTRSARSSAARGHGPIGAARSRATDRLPGALRPLPHRTPALRLPDRRRRRASPTPAPAAATWLVRMEDLDRPARGPGRRPTDPAHPGRPSASSGTARCSTRAPGPTPTRRGSTRLAEALTYPCGCSRSGDRPRRPLGAEGPVYPGTCRSASRPGGPRGPCAAHRGPGDRLPGSDPGHPTQVVASPWGTSWCAAPMGSTPITWRWSWTTPGRGSPRWCAVPTFWPPPPARSSCSRHSACPPPPMPISHWPWVLTGASSASHSPPPRWTRRTPSRRCTGPGHSSVRRPWDPRDPPDTSGPKPFLRWTPTGVPVITWPPA
jgi:DnaK suppressor protein